MAYIDSEYKTYHDAAETFIKNAHETLQNPAVIRALGEHAEVLMEYANDLFIPNVSHGNVQYINNETYENGIPLIILPYGAEYKLDPRYLSLSPKTRSRMHTYVNQAYTGLSTSSKNRVFDTINAYAQAHDNSLNIGESADAEASRNTGIYYAGKKEGTIPIPYVSRSVLVVKPNAAVKPHSGVLFIHEGTHLTQIDKQLLSLPLRAQRKRFLYALHLETDAYQRESDAISALYPNETPKERHDIVGSYAPYLEDALQGSTIETRAELITRLTAQDRGLGPEAEELIAA